MAHQWYRGNLSAAIFPFAVELWGRSIIVPQYDQNFDRTITSSSDQDKDKGVPQAFYMHNCMPTGQGYQAIGYDTDIVGLAGVTDFDAAFPIQDAANVANFLFVPAAGKNYVFDKTVGTWASVSPLAPGTVPDNVLVTSAFIQGQSYINYANNGAYKYDTVTKTLPSVTLTAIDPTTNKGICAANGYMLAWNDTDIAWSSATDPTDFTPSLVTGAGGGSVAEAKGKIIVVLPISGGFIAYCEKNAVAGKYTGNIRFPFVLTEIVGSGGITSPEQVSWQSNLTEHYAWTTVGFQQIDKSKATLVFPELTDFLANLIFDDYDETTKLFTTTDLTTPLYIKVTAVSARYIVASYGVTSPNYTHALVYDLALKRWGKFKITHRDCFQWNSPSLYGALTYGQLFMTYGDLINTTYGDLLTGIRSEDTPKKTIAFLQEDGTVKVVNFDLSQTVANGVLALGKFQFQRNKRIVHQESDIENVNDGRTFAYYIFPTNDGKTFLPAITPYLSRDSIRSKRYARGVDCQNFAAVCVGAFNLTSYLFNFTIGGDT